MPEALKARDKGHAAVDRFPGRFLHAVIRPFSRNAADEPRFTDGNVFVVQGITGEKRTLLLHEHAGRRKQ